LQKVISLHLKEATSTTGNHFWFKQELVIGLIDYHGTPMYKTRRKTAFVGLLCTIDSVLGIYNEYVAVVNATLKYLLTYMTSQDNNELFLVLYIEINRKYVELLKSLKSAL